MSMKLSYRDKVILIVVIVVAILLAGIFLVIKPKYTDLQASNVRVDAKQAELDQATQKAATLETLKNQLKSDIEEVDELQSDFLFESEYGETYEALQYVMDILADTEITIQGIDIQLLSARDIDNYTYQKYAAAYQLKLDADINNELPPEVEYTLNNSWPADTEPAQTIAGTTVEITFTAPGGTDLDPLYTAVDSISNDEKTLLISEFSAENSTGLSVDTGAVAEETVEGSMTIYVYEIWPMDVDSIK